MKSGDAILTPFWSAFRSQKTSFFEVFFMCVSTGQEVRDPAKLPQIPIKSRFIDLGNLLKNDQKTMKNRFENVDPKQTPF